MGSTTSRSATSGLPVDRTSTEPLAPATPSPPSQQDQTIQVRVSFTDDAEHSETLTSVATEAVAAEPADPLTASFSNMPASHNGSSVFTFDLAFSENVDAGYARIRDDAFNVSGGNITKAQRNTQGSNQSWTITVQPDGNGAVSITLPQTTDCDATGAICTHDWTEVVERHASFDRRAKLTNTAPPPITTATRRRVHTGRAFIKPSGQDQTRPDSQPASSSTIMRCTSLAETSENGQASHESADE